MNWLMNLTPQIFLSSEVFLVFLAHFSTVLVSDSFHFSNRICGIVIILLAVSGMDFSRCQPLCSRLISSDDQHCKCVRCVGLAHAWGAIFGISSCMYCENFTLKTLRAWLMVFDQESAILPHCVTPEAFSLCEAAAWSSDAELEAMEIHCLHFWRLFPISLHCLGVTAWILLVEVLARATEKLSWDWPDEPCESQSSKLDEYFLSGSGLRPARKKPLFPDLHHEIFRSWKQPFYSRLTNADFSNLVGSVEQGYAAAPGIEDTLAAHLSPTSFRLSHVGPPPLWSVSHT